MTIQSTAGVTIEVAEIMPKEMKSLFVKNVLRTLEHKCGDVPFSEYASSNVHQIISDYGTPETIRCAALHIFGSTCPDAIEKLKTLKIIVEGYCPECGEKLDDDFFSTVEADYDTEGQGISYQACTKCNYNNLSTYL